MKNKQNVDDLNDNSKFTQPLLNPVDIKYLGIPNICFSLTDENDKREIELQSKELNVVLMIVKHGV